MGTTHIDTEKAREVASALQRLADSGMERPDRPAHLPTGDHTVIRLAQLLGGLMDSEAIVARGSRGAIRELEEQLKQTLEIAMWADLDAATWRE
jgi:hypothetical protein